MEVKPSLARFYRGKSVLITGHTGFKGAWLATWLKMMGSQVTGVALPPKEGSRSLFCSACVASGMKSHFADIRHPGAILRFFRKCEPEIVIHNAAQSLVLESYRNPVETYMTNVMGTVQVLEAARQSRSVRALVVVTSDKCYDNREWIWGYREHDRLGGRDPYSSSKACAELVTAAYRHSFFEGKSHLGVASARAGNVIGGGDWAEHRLVPDIIRGFIRKSKIRLRNPGAIRPWQHVLEPLYGYLLLAERLFTSGVNFAGAWNFGPQNEPASVAEVARKMVKLWGDPSVKISADRTRVHEADLLMIDSTKARRLLGWRSVLSLEEALEMTVAWYRAWAEHPDSSASLTRAQIQPYMNRVC